MNKTAITALVIIAFALLIMNLIFEFSGDTQVNSARNDVFRQENTIPSPQKTKLSATPPAPRAAADISVAQEGLVAYYPFNGNADDHSGNGNHGTIHGASLTQDRFGNPNSAYYFDGNSKIIVPDNHSLKPQNSITICAWIKTEKQNVDDYIRILSKHGEVTDAGGSHGSYQLISGRSKNRGAYDMTLKTTQKYDYTRTKYEISLLEWQFILGTWDGNTAYIYHNGELAGAVDISGSIKYDSNPLIIGSDGYYKHVNYKGIIDEIRIYNRYLTQSEVRCLYKEYDCK